MIQWQQILTYLLAAGAVVFIAKAAGLKLPALPKQRTPTH